MFIIGLQNKELLPGNICLNEHSSDVETSSCKKSIENKISLINHLNLGLKESVCDNILNNFKNYSPSHFLHDDQIKNKENQLKNVNADFKILSEIKNKLERVAFSQLTNIYQNNVLITPRKIAKIVNTQDLASYSPEYCKIYCKNHKFVPDFSSETVEKIKKKFGEIIYIFKSQSGEKYPGAAVDGRKRVLEHCEAFLNPSPPGKIVKLSKEKFHSNVAKKLNFSEGTEQPLEVGFLPTLGFYNKKGEIETLAGYKSEQIWIAALQTQAKGYSIRSGGNGRPSKMEPTKREAEYVISDLTSEIISDKGLFKEFLAKLKQGNAQSVFPLK